MTRSKSTLGVALATAMSCTFALSSAYAQQSSQNENDKKNATQQGDDQPWLQLNSNGWVRIATDYDDDGKYDAAGTIYLQDLMDAMNLSRDRAENEARQRQTAERRDDAQRSQSQSRESQRHQAARPNLDDRRRSGSHQTADEESFRISGTLKEVKRVNFLGTEESSHIVARIRNQEGRTAKALLGPQSQLKKLDLSVGDRVTVEGMIGRVNDRTMLLADSVSSRGQQVEVKRQDSRNVKRVTAEIRELRPVSFRGFDDRFVVAEVELENGRDATVHLGTLSAIKDAGISRGDEVEMLARPVRINGKPGLIADEVSFQGEKLESQNSSQRQQR